MIIEYPLYSFPPTFRPCKKLIIPMFPVNLSQSSSDNLGILNTSVVPEYPLKSEIAIDKFRITERFITCILCALKSEFLSSVCILSSEFCNSPNILYSLKDVSFFTLELCPPGCIVIEFPFSSTASLAFKLLNDEFKILSFKSYACV